MSTLMARLLALAMAAALLAALALYPLERNWLALILPLYAGLLWRWPDLWLFLLPALLPVLDLAPLTGWFFLEEIDLLLMITTASCYWRWRPASAMAQLPPAMRASLAALAVACALGLWRGVQPLPPIDANSFNNYLSAYNAVRVGKAWLWLLILLPPLRQAVGPQLAGIQRYLLPGMMTGLVLVALADVRERMLFPGLLNFASDYRSSAPFSAMHTGGAALDGYLALSCPLLAMWLFGHHGAKRGAIALLLLPLAGYAGLTTFSRGLYAAYAAAALLLLALPLLPRLWPAATLAARGPAAPPATTTRHATAMTGINSKTALLAAVSLAALGLALNAMFAVSGYRGLAAALALLATSFFLAAQRLPALPMIVAVLVGGMAALWLALLPPGGAGADVSKTPYLLFAVSLLVFCASAPLPLLHRPVALPLALCGFSGLMPATVWIALHWAGRGALPASIGVLAVALLPLLFSLLLGRPLWRLARQSITPLLVGLLLLAVLIPIAHGYYVAERFSTSGQDLAYRLRHWRQVLAMLEAKADSAPASTLLGAGFGTFPATFFWNNPDREVPPSYRYIDQGNNRYLQLRAADYPAGYGELLRMLQPVRVRADRPYLLSLDVWNNGPPAYLHVNLCQRLLLYPQNCIAAPMPLIKAGPLWQRYHFPLQSGPLDGAGGALQAPVQLELAVEGAHAVLNIDNVSLLDAIDSHELLRNGAFSDANNYWFFSSDRHHLPWHIKNLALNLYFELGWPGLLAFATLLASVCAELLGRLRRGEQPGDAAAWLAALLAFQVVGLFDSLFDVPRITLLYMLLLCAAGLRANASLSAASSAPLRPRGHRA